MGLLAVAVTAWAAAQAVLSSPLPIHAQYVLKETHYVPPKWRVVGEPHPLQMINLQVGIKQGNFDELERHLNEISDPDHRRYGQHLAKEEVEELVRPTDDTSSRISAWLSSHGVEPHDCQYSPAGDWVTATLPVSSVERLLDAKYFIFEHEDGTRLVRTIEWSLPSDIHDHITTIQPTTAFLRASPKGQTVQEVPGTFELPLPLPASAKSIAQVCNFSAVTTRCLRTLYNTLNYIPRVPGKNKIGFTNYLGEITNRSDASIFLSNFRPEAVSSAYSFKQVSIANGAIDNGTSGAGLEGNLDIETILGLVWPTPTTSYATGGSPPFVPDSFTRVNTNEPYLTWVNSPSPYPPRNCHNVCNQFAQLGARGVSLFFSAGDEGVGPNGSCISNDGRNTSQFLPAFPASCPYVTAVGGTKNFPERVAFDSRNGYASGSGFSNYFPRPTYQESAVKRYLPKIPASFRGLYNASGRAYPDLAAQGYRYLTIYNGSIRSLDGTSCSAPTMASIFSLVNDALIAKGKGMMGWLNPWLYKHGHKAFNDVLGGSSVGCDGKGFEATSGWDVASGWGTVDFERVLDVLGLK